MEPELLSLRVMRLPKPSFNVNHFLNYWEKSLSEEFSLASNSIKLDCVLPAANLSESLLVPQNFGSIYGGETFTCFMSVHNCSTQNCKNVVVKADIVFEGKIVYNMESAPHAILTPSSNIDVQMSYRLQRVGEHQLVCIVSYESEKVAERSFKKTFKLPVNQPFEFTTTVHNAEGYLLTDRSPLVLEIGLRSLIVTPIVVDQLQFRPAAAFRLLDSPDQHHTLFPSSKPLRQGEIFSFAVRLLSTLAGAKSLLDINTDIVLGNALVSWTTQFNQSGHFESSNIIYKLPAPPVITVKAVDYPQTVVVEKPFSLKVHIQNLGDHEVELKMLWTNAIAGLQWINVASGNLIKLRGLKSQQNTTVVTLQAIFYRVGLLSISGLLLEDMLLNRTYKCDDLGVVNVISAS